MSGILLQPFIPDKAGELLDRLGVEGRRWENVKFRGGEGDGRRGAGADAGGKKEKGVLFPNIEMPGGTPA